MTTHRRPELDGLRGVAVLMVMVEHFADMDRAVLPPGLGDLGVVVFFALSGYLITSILVREHERTGRLNLRAFYIRRARRLFPALYVMLGVATVILVSRGDGRHIPEAIGAPLLYVGNYVSAFPTAHTWSLAFEEQFYIVWPALLVGLLLFGREKAVVLTAGLAVILLVVTVAPSRAWAPATMLVGCCFALSSLRIPGKLGWPAAVAFLPLCLIVDDTARIPAVVGAVLTCMVIGATSDTTSALHHVLCSRVLCHFGKISYGLYLWHGLLLFWLAYSPAFGGSLALRVLCLAPISYCAALLSYELLERRFTRSPSLIPQIGRGTVAQVVEA